MPLAEDATIAIVPRSVSATMTELTRVIMRPAPETTRSSSHRHDADFATNPVSGSCWSVRMRAFFAVSPRQLALRIHRSRKDTPRIKLGAVGVGAVLDNAAD
jgi:hypothetical protein